MPSSEIIGIGGYVPEKRVRNQDLEELLNTSDDWIKQRSGIEARHWAEKEQATSDLALIACQRALEHAGTDKSKIDLLVVATSSSDFAIPGTAAALQAKLELGETPFFEIKQACSGFVYGLSLVDNFIKSGAYRCVLLVGAELQSKMLDLTPNGRAASVLFADGAGALVIRAREVSGAEKTPPVDLPQVFKSQLKGNGKSALDLCIRSPGTSNGEHFSALQHIEDGRIYLSMNSRQVFAGAVSKMSEVLISVVQESGFSLSDVDLFFFHQANLRINEKIASDLAIPAEKVHNTIMEFGNTTAATIPLGMWDAHTKGILKKGQLIACCAFGAGFGWGATVLRY